MCFVPKKNTYLCFYVIDLHTFANKNHPFKQKDEIFLHYKLFNKGKK